MLYYVKKMYTAIERDDMLTVSKYLRKDIDVKFSKLVVASIHFGSYKVFCRLWQHLTDYSINVVMGKKFKAAVFRCKNLNISKFIISHHSYSKETIKPYINGIMRRGDVEFIEYLVSRYKYTYNDLCGKYDFMHFIKQNNPEMVKFLITTFKLAKEVNDCLMHVCEFGLFDILKILCNRYNLASYFEIGNVNIKLTNMLIIKKHYHMLTYIVEQYGIQLSVVTTTLSLKD